MDRKPRMTKFVPYIIILWFILMVRSLIAVAFIVLLARPTRAQTRTKEVLVPVHPSLVRANLGLSTWGVLRESG